jgi:hypothetical protein
MSLTLIHDAVLVISLALYFLPTIVALTRGASRTTAVIVINLLLAWTVIGWIVALVLASTSTRRVRV